jgi:hypothetical protein
LGLHFFFDDQEKFKTMHDRWEKFLSPNIDQRLWSKEEDSLLMDKRRELAAHWVKILQFFS